MENAGAEESHAIQIPLGGKKEPKGQGSMYMSSLVSSACCQQQGCWAGSPGAGVSGLSNVTLREAEVAGRERWTTEPGEVGEQGAEWELGGRRALWCL